MMFIHFLTYLFLFRVAITEKYKSIKAIEDDLYQKVIEAKCSGNFKLKVGYTAEEKRVWRFCVNKNYCDKDVINKINGEKEKRIVCTNYFFLMLLKHVTTAEVDARCVKAVIKSL